MINYTWIVTDLVTLDTDDRPDYVVFANCKVEASEGEFSSVYESLYDFQIDEGASFIPYQNLTNDLVIGWIKFRLGEEGVYQIELDLANQIAFKKNPPKAPQIKPLPW
jgi:hypothetical protein